MKKLLKSVEKLTKKEKREFDRIQESLKVVNSYETQKEFLKGKTFINDFHTVESKVLTF